MRDQAADTAARRALGAALSHHAATTAGVVRTQAAVRIWGA